MFPKNDGLTQTEITEDEKENDQLLGVDEMMLRVSELEKECSSMKREIQKFGKPKSGWGIFSKRFGFGSKSHTTLKDK